MRFSRQTGDQQVMANTLESMKGYMDRLTYEIHLPVLSSDQVGGGAPSFQNLGSFSRALRMGNGTNDIRWLIHKRYDWVRGTLNAEVMIQTEAVGTYTGNVSIGLDIVAYPTGTDLAGPGIPMLTGADVFDITTIPVDTTVHYEIDGIEDVTTAEDSLLAIKFSRTSSTSNEYIYVAGIELFYHPTLER